MYMDDIILFAKKERQLEALIQGVKYTARMDFVIEKCVMLIMKSGNWNIKDAIKQLN